MRVLISLSIFLLGARGLSAPGLGHCTGLPDPLPRKRAAQCLDALEARISSRTAAQNARYLSLTGGRSGIKKDNESLLYRGTKAAPAVLLVHGFISSPFEVRQLALALNASGYTVLTPLIEGFGGEDQVANAVGRERWRASIDEAVEDLSSCYKDIALAGFSLGAGLVVDYAFNRHRPDRPRPWSSLGAARTITEEPGRARISSISLLSPYIKTAVPLAAPLNRLSRVFSRRGTASFELIRRASRLTGSENLDLRIPMRHPDYYNTAMPLRAVSQVLRFSKEVRLLPKDAVSDIPAFLAYSEMDRTISWTLARDFTARHFQKVESFIFGADMKVAHQLALAESGADVATLARKLITFFDRPAP